MTTSAELPSADLYEAFDVVTSVNGPLTWSKRPELVAKNLVQMVKPGGLLFVQIGYNIHTKIEFDYSFFYKFPHSFAFPLIANPNDETELAFYFMVKEEQSSNY
jgi:SAM-dependent methyltransferase